MAMNDPAATSVAAYLPGPSGRLARNDTTAPSVEDYANVFGPGAYNIQPDVNRNRKYGRLQIPDVLKGPNQWITDRVDGLITDATNSPFTTVILPYMYMDYPDRKVEWNVWTFDQGLASRVPYESAARTLTQRKQSFSGYTVRQGLAISMEHNFMMTTEGMENFQNQIKQVVGSIQNTNDLDVHMALITAPSYMMQVRERYYLDDYLSKALRDYIDTFGFVQKNMNAMDIIIEDTKSIIKNWGGDEPDFLLCSNKLCFQLTMTQERTSYFTQGTDGKKLLKDGPTLDVYRNLKIVKSKAFSLDEGSAPRDIMRRRVRVGEFYNGPLNGLTGVRLYDEDSDNFEVLGIDKIWRSWYATALVGGANGADPHDAATPDIAAHGGVYYAAAVCQGAIAGAVARAVADEKGLMLLRCNIEHYMLGVIIGKGGMDHLGATLWGQTEMSVFDDGQHGVWGMTYKYHERAMVFNERNLHKVWDVAYDGYCGGKDLSVMPWTIEGVNAFQEASQNTSRNFSGKSIICVPYDSKVIVKSPMPMCSNSDGTTTSLATADMMISDIKNFSQQQTGGDPDAVALKAILSVVYDALKMHNEYAEIKDAVAGASSGETTICRLMYKGTSTWMYNVGHHANAHSTSGCGHHGNDYVGVASVRNGKSLMNSAAPVVGGFLAPFVPPPA